MNKICEWSFEYRDENNVRRYKTSCTNLMNYPKLGSYCPCCGGEIKIILTEREKIKNGFNGEQYEAKIQKTMQP